VQGMRFTSNCIRHFIER